MYRQIDRNNSKGYSSKKKKKIERCGPCNKYDGVRAAVSYRDAAKISITLTD